MRMRFEDLQKNEIEKVVNIYLCERNTIVGIISIEDFVKKYLRRCENCNDLVCVYEVDDDLNSVVNYRGEFYKICEKCEKIYV